MEENIVRPTRESIAESLRASCRAVREERIAMQRLIDAREEEKRAEQDWKAAHAAAQSAANEWGKVVSIAELSDLEELTGIQFGATP